MKIVVSCCNNYLRAAFPLREFSNIVQGEINVRIWRSGSSVSRTYRPVDCGFKPMAMGNGCHSVYLGKVLPWAEDFHQYIICDICGLVPDHLSSVGLHQAIGFPPTAISGKWSNCNEIGYSYFVTVRLCMTTL